MKTITHSGRAKELIYIFNGIIDEYVEDEYLGDALKNNDFRRQMIKWARAIERAEVQDEF